MICCSIPLYHNPLLWTQMAISFLLDSLLQGDYWLELSELTLALLGLAWMKTRLFWRLQIQLSSFFRTHQSLYQVGRVLNIEQHFLLQNLLVQISIHQIWTKWYTMAMLSHMLKNSLFSTVIFLNHSQLWISLADINQEHTCSLCLFVFL